MAWKCYSSCTSGLYIELNILANADEDAGDLHAVCDATRSLEVHNHKDGHKKELLGFDEGQEGPKLPSLSSRFEPCGERLSEVLGLERVN